MQRYVLHSHKLYSIKTIHNFYQNLSWVPCCIFFLGVNSGKSKSRQLALNGRLCLEIVHTIGCLRKDPIGLLSFTETADCLDVLRLHKGGVWVGSFDESFRPHLFLL